MIRIKDILNEVRGISANTDVEAFDQFRDMYSKSFPTPSHTQWNITNDDGIRKWYTAVKEWYTKNFGVNNATMKRLFVAYDLSRDSDKSVTFKGRKYKFSTTMDVREYAFAVLVDAGFIKFKSKHDHDAERERRKAELLKRLGG